VIGRIVALALNTFREAVRDRVLYSLLFFAVLLIISALALGQLSVHEDARVTLDLGLGGIAVFGVLIAIFVGVNLIYKDLDKKIVFALLSKPIYRHEFIVGKFAGMSVTLAVQIAIMTVCLCGVLAVEGMGFDSAVLRSATLTLLEVLVVTSIAILFSSFSTPFLSGAFTIGIFIIGRSVPELRELISKMPAEAPRRIISTLLHLVPDLHLFYVSGSLVDGRYVSVHGDYVAWAYVAWAALYAGGYIVCSLVVASLLFSRRDFI
jgi:ABC-type transport system involved in multi-copper enzyme maturation permease subunit